jgi:hypothetical protein
MLPKADRTTKSNNTLEPESQLSDVTVLMEDTPDPNWEETQLVI